MVGSRRDVVEQGALCSYSYASAKVGKAAAGRHIDRILKAPSEATRRWRR